MKVVRVLVYEGPEEWVAKSLSTSQVGPRRPFEPREGHSIKLMRQYTLLPGTPESEILSCLAELPEVAE